MRLPSSAPTRNRARSSTRALATCAGLLLVATAAAGQTCPCTRRDLATVVKQADVIFVGTPLSATTDMTTTAGRPPTETQARLAFDVGLVLKGTTTRATTVVSPLGPCGAGFAVGTEYLVIGTKQGAGIVTDACQGNLAGAEAIRARAAAIRAVLTPKVPEPTPSAAH
ncbi:MAG: hypothetical protein U0842_11225 [Candidatus Binatia bacterium]